MTSKLRIGIDIGGTFTDAIAVSPNGVFTAKVPSNKTNPGAAVLEAVAQLNLTETPDRFLHGTTLVTNMLLERKGASTGFITSSGMRDVLHIGRHERPMTYAIKQEIPHQHHPPSPRKWRLTVPERINANGEVIIPLDEASIRSAARQLADAGVESIAVGFLHAFRYPDHENRAAEWIRDEVPDSFVCTSSEISPRFREYERFLTTVWNARVAPGAARYLANLAGEIGNRWPGLQLTLMTSNGGLEEIDMLSEEVHGDLRRTPIRLGLSGPAAAGNAVTRVTKELGLKNCVGLDVGGTSSDIVVVRNGRLREAPWEERRVGGYPLQIPMLDLYTIGAGGGSLVNRDEFGALHVGPQSAGAVPGPACYDRGGAQPTVTDAAAVAGRLPANLLLGGTMPIKTELAYQTFAEVFKTDEKSLIKAALDVLALAEANIAFGIRERTVARGLDPAELALVAAGGAGPLLACGVAEMLELAEVIVPPRPGLLAAWGLLVAPDRRESAITVLLPLGEITPDQSKNYFEQAHQALSAPPPDGAGILRTAALRYLGQGFEVEINIDDPSDLAEMGQRFHQAHHHEYGFAMPDAPVEWVELRVAWEIPAEPWQFPISGDQGELSYQEVDLWELRSKSEGKPEPVLARAKLFQRTSLSGGTEIEGPAIVVEKDATVYIPTGWKANITHNGYIRIKSYEHK
ncbi:MAG: hydantoinase/oxoprolinase family protein [Chloroflexi bacterium]|nr:hydantoinase/oxoprolinase family protein [Chloroflexota bacterium]